MKIIPLQVSGRGISEIVYALLDEGSTVSIIDKIIVKRLGLARERTSIKIKGFGPDNSIFAIQEKVSLRVANVAESFDIRDVLIVDDLGLPECEVSKEMSDYCELKSGVKVPSFRARPKILLGQDNIHLTVNLETIILNRCGLVLSRCTLGWSIHGVCGEREVRLVLSSESRAQLQGGLRRAS